MRAIDKLLARLEREIPQYEFSSNWLVKYTSGDREYDHRGFRFRAMGSHRETPRKSIFVHSKVSITDGVKGKLIPINGSDDFYLEGES